MASQNSLDQSLETLLNGVRRFKRDIYPKNSARYRQAASQPQKPHTLFITCADSRIDPELLTQSGPGEIFVSRNIGNVVPPYGALMGGVSAVIEYAVLALAVDLVVVCGHTDCGAMKGLLHREALAAMPTVSSWLNNAEAALSIVKARDSLKDESSKLLELAEENVLLQLNHLRTHPSVAGKMAQGKLAVYGWVYDIAHGDIYVHNTATHRFVKVGEETASA